MRKLIFALPLALIALTIPADAVDNNPTKEPSRHRWLPPQEYDRPYTGRLEVITHETLIDVQAACPSVPNPLACAKVFGPGKCEIHLPPAYMYTPYGATADVIMRHEIAHCNGWVHAPDYKGTITAAVEKPPKPTSEPTASQPTDDAAKEEERKTHQIATTYKRCLLERSGDGWKKTYSKEEIDNYCGCFSVLINERVPDKEWREAVAAGTWGKHPALAEVTSYCTKKYYNMPDVTEIRKKKW